MDSKVFLLSDFNTGHKEVTFEGHPLEDGWNICVLDSASGKANLVVLESYIKSAYKHAKDNFEKLDANISGCGVYLVLCDGAYQVDPSELDSNGQEIVDCNDCGNCPTCKMWEDYFKHCEES